jgi:hypothetical protein
MGGRVDPGMPIRHDARDGAWSNLVKFVAAGYGSAIIHWFFMHISDCAKVSAGGMIAAIA